MRPTSRLVLGGIACLMAGMAATISHRAVLAQQAPAPASSAQAAQAACEPKTFTTAEDHQNMMDQLGIKALRPGPSGNEQAPNHANYDEALANPFPDLPDVLTLNNGRKVTSPAMWAERRKEIIEDFEREVLGRIPPNVPKVTWTVTETGTGTIEGMPVVGKQLVGHVDNSGCQAITVDIPLTLVTPANAKGPVPVMIMFRGGTLAVALGNAPPTMGRGGFTPPAGRAAAAPPAGQAGATPPAGQAGAAPPAGRAAAAPPATGRAGFTPPAGMLGNDPPATEQLIADGWGFAFLNPNSIQADNGAGLTRGIIGLVNRGQPRKPDDWGSLRAWSWGAARALDYFETDRTVDAKHVGIEGVSRYGKAALITMAFEPRFAVVLVGSSGEGGAKLHRRNWGEAVENLTGSGEYHWMAGNFLKYGASEAVFGSKNAGDIPVDAHELIALCAPRATFISYGVPERGDAKWLDQQGSYMAAVAAGPVFRLLGAKDLGVSDDYKTEKMPPVNTGLLNGRLAWRQHDGGHTDGPNWKYFIPWADRQFGRVPPKAPSADQPVARTDQNSQTAHEQLLEKKKQGRTDIYFVGDSIVRRWGATDYPELLANWKQNFFGWNAADFGWGADRTQNILWRLEHGELDGVNPRVIVILAGTNNVGSRPGDAAKVVDITSGIKAIVDTCRSKAPRATIILTAIFPRNDNMAVMPEINAINANIAKFADGKRVRYLDINDRLADKDGKLFEGVMNEKDKLHPELKGYQIWADALKPIFTELLGPPAATDLAPPPTGDPSAKAK
jgi:lysophospholipase L1-like esterase